MSVPSTTTVPYYGTDVTADELLVNRAIEGLAVTLMIDHSMERIQETWEEERKTIHRNLSSSQYFHSLPNQGANHGRSSSISNTFQRYSFC